MILSLEGSGKEYELPDLKLCSEIVAEDPFEGYEQSKPNIQVAE